MTKNNSGVTFLEVITVVAIIGILGAIAVPTYLGMRTDRELRGAVYAMKADLLKSKLAAIKYGAEGCTVFDNAANSYQSFVNVTNQGVCNFDGDDFVLQPTTFMPPSVTFTATFTNVRFNNKGLPESGAGAGVGNVEFLSTDGNRLRVTMNLVGRLRIHGPPFP